MPCTSALEAFTSLFFDWDGCVRRPTRRIRQHHSNRGIQRPRLLSQRVPVATTTEGMLHRLAPQFTPLRPNLALLLMLLLTPPRWRRTPIPLAPMGSRAIALAIATLIALAVASTLTLLVATAPIFMSRRPGTLATLRLLPQRLLPPPLFIGDRRIHRPLLRAPVAYGCHRNKGAGEWRGRGKGEERSGKAPEMPHFTGTGRKP